MMPEFIMIGLNLFAGALLCGMGGTIGVLIVLSCVDVSISQSHDQDKGAGQ